MGLELIATVTETVSTNDDLAAAACRSPEGTWLRAERQSGGRGRQGRTWVSPPGNLYASTLVRLRPSDPPAPTLALVAAVALHDIASAWAPAAGIRIKWPNDLLAGGAKLAGILLERAGDAVVIGFGVNLAHHPDGLPRPVTSIAALTGSAPPPALFTEQLAEAFARSLEQWRSAGVSAVRTAWLARAHPVGTALSTADGEGLFEGLDEGGGLRLRLPNGETRLIHAGDVFLL
jgi:BirA family biotin operon repressor/biotin-[acetyl-CoA-carboxylase] ligase